MIDGGGGVEGGEPAPCLCHLEDDTVSLADLDDCSVDCRMELILHDVRRRKPALATVEKTGGESESGQ